jgi:hypothetical protein
MRRLWKPNASHSQSTITTVLWYGIVGTTALISFNIAFKFILYTDFGYGAVSVAILSPKVLEPTRTVLSVKIAVDDLSRDTKMLCEDPTSLSHLSVAQLQECRFVQRISFNLRHQMIH